MALFKLPHIALYAKEFLIAIENIFYPKREKLIIKA